MRQSKNRAAALAIVMTGLAVAAGAGCSSSPVDTSVDPDAATPDQADSGLCEGPACGGEDGAPPDTDGGTEHDAGSDAGSDAGADAAVDCGGPDEAKPRCEAGEPCAGANDCASHVCTGGVCQAPTATDHVKNGSETDVDCGGPDAAVPRCATGATCAVHGDCASDGCAYDKTCASHPSCTNLDGGYTCGPLETNARQADCCASAAVGPYTVDKYLVTAGRMRAFLDRLGGDVATWAAGLPAAKWDQSFTAKLPHSWAEANTELGPYYDKRACQAGDHTGHVFWTPPTAEDREDFSKEVTDRKALNCVPWWLLSAFCVWDGGHLATEAELRAAYTNNNTTSYPWGARGTYATNTQNDYAIQRWTYATPSPPAAARTDPSGYLDIVFYVAPPGRRPMGYNATGHADLVGDLLEWVSDRDRQFIWNGSWENHSAEADGYTPAPNDPYLARDTHGKPWQWGYNVGIGRPGDGEGYGYYGIGGRCAR